jgi:hypothetical protein
MTYRFRVVETTDQDGQPQWQIRGVKHSDDGTPVSYAGPAVALALPDDGTSPADSLRVQLQAMMAALDEPIVKGGDLTVDGDVG